MKPSHNFFNGRNIILFVSTILSLLCLAYFTKGFYHLIFDPTGAKDLHSRWQEQQYIYRGLYPYDMRKDSPQIIAELGPIISGGYPPWAFFTGFVVFPPISWELTRWYHAFLNIISLSILGWFAYQIGRPYGKLKAWFTTVACLSISSHTTTLGLGQYGIIINALLIGVFCFLQNRQNIIAGLLLGLALAKPNISALYFFVLIVRKQTRSVLACCLYILVASSVIGGLVKLSPIYMLFSEIQVASYFVQSGSSGINILMNLGINPAVAIILSGLLATSIILLVLFCIKNSNLIYLFAIASVIGRLWTYHLIYDNVMLIFLLIAVIKMTWDKPNQSNIVVLSLVLMSLVIPAKIAEFPYAIILQSVIWIGSVIYLLIFQKEYQR
ncbi:glycosyltransferase 87 family protein [Nostoc sp. CALU 1950]|uniref:glycosyltransferase 87 family protein n=1 Tax=Nostoc sp. CALU 1950 TaxID=3104321 RepID=UPI003EBD8CDD